MKYFLILPMFFLLMACDSKQEISGASKMHWDRDMCDRCVMVMSDRKNSVQVQTKKPKITYKFDDIGCMVLWNEEAKLGLETALIWVTDANTGEWIDARTAFYTAGNVTPMAFGFSAYKTKETINKESKIFTYDDVYKKIKK